MAKSQRRTKTAILRAAIGLSAKDFAALIDKSIHTQKALEAGRLALGWELSRRIADVTGVSFRWLEDDTVSGEPFTQSGEPLTPESFRSHGAPISPPVLARRQFRKVPEELSSDLRWILKAAMRTPYFEFAAFRTANFIEKLGKELGIELPEDMGRVRIPFEEKSAEGFVLQMGLPEGFAPGESERRKDITVLPVTPPEPKKSAGSKKKRS